MALDDRYLAQTMIQLAGLYIYFFKYFKNHLYFYNLTYELTMLKIVK